MNIEDLKTVYEDLVYLRDEWTNISDPEIRRGSAILRRLLVEDQYGVAWRALNFEKQPKLYAVDLEYILRKRDYNEVIVALAGGANMNGVVITSTIVIKSPGIEFDNNVSPERAITDEREYVLTEFLSSVCGVAQGQKIFRRDVIKYFANIRGGVHVGGSQRAKEKLLISRIEKFEKKILFSSREGLLLELSAIGQAIGNSNDANIVIKKIKELL